MAKNKKVALKVGKGIKKIKAESIKQKKLSSKVNPKNNIIFLISLVVVLIGAVFFEITYMSKQSVMKSIKPEFVRMWDHHPYTGIDLLKVYGDFIYGIDDDKGMVIKFDRLTGKIIHILDIKEPIRTCVEGPEGSIFVLDKNGILKKFNNKYDMVEKVVLPVGLKPIWIDIDSQNNFIIVDGATMKVHKFDSAFIDLLSFDGVGKANDNIDLLLKVFVGPKDDLYCLSADDKTTKKKVSIFNKDGKFIKAWPIRKIDKFSRYDNLAITPDGYVYMNSDATNNIYVFTNDGRLVSKFNACKNDECVLTFPGCITGGMNGELYVYTHKIVAIKNIQY